jgi:hypothetical protein
MTGKVHWAKVLGAPVPNYNRDGNEWTVDFTPNEEGYQLMEDIGIDNKLKNKDDARGRFIQFKQREKRADGTPNFPITVVDALNRPWDPKLVDGKVTNPIGNESTCEIKFKVVNYGAGKPVGIYPQAIRVLDLAPYVRQEFAPLPEDSEYVQKLEVFDEAEDEVVNEGPVEDDPLGVDEEE